MELSDLTYDDWDMVMRALSLKAHDYRKYAETRDGARREEILAWADHLKRLHDRFEDEFRARGLRGELRRPASSGSRPGPG